MLIWIKISDDIGFALRQIQKGKNPSCTKPWRGLGARVVVYALHCFQKKSKRGTGTPPRDKNLVVERLKQADAHYKANY